MIHHVFIVFCGLFCLPGFTQACIMPEKRTVFADFGLRSDVVLRAEVVNTSPINTGVKGRYDATFRIIGLFSAKSENFAIGDTIKLGEFGKRPACTPLKPKSRHILFLKKSTFGNSLKFQLRYNPVPLSIRNVYFFHQVLKDRNFGRGILKSGCGILEKPLNGKYQCTPNLERCRIKCNKGYKLTGGSKYKTCNSTTGRWKPEKTNNCFLDIKRPKLNSRILFNWSPQKRKLGSGVVEEIEEVEEENNVKVLVIRTKPKTWSFTAIKQISVNEGEDEEEERELEEVEEEKEIVTKKVTIKPGNKNSFRSQIFSYLNIKKVEEIENEVLQEEKTENTVLKPATNINYVKPAANNLHEKQQTIQNETNHVKSNSSRLTEPITSAIEIKSTLNVGSITVNNGDLSEIENEDISLRSLETGNVQEKPETINSINEISHQLESSSANTDSATVNTGSSQTTPEPHTRSVLTKNDSVIGASWTIDNGLLYQPVSVPSLDDIFGCPTVQGNVTIFSSWRDGFSGNAYFPKFLNHLISDWIIQISFDLEVQELETFTVDLLSFSHSKQDYCYKAKDYNKVIYLGQDLTLTFVGKILEEFGDTPIIKARVFMYGQCEQHNLKDRQIGTLMPIGYDSANKENSWATNSDIDLATNKDEHDDS